MCATDVAAEPADRRPAGRPRVRQGPAGRNQDRHRRVRLVRSAGRPADRRHQEQLLTAIDRLTTSRGTAIGLAILASVDAIAEINPEVAPTGVDLGVSTDAGPTGGGGVAGYQPDAIVVLTDGRNSDGVDPITAAEQAAARHLRVYTIGFGTANPSGVSCTGARSATAEGRWVRRRRRPTRVRDRRADPHRGRRVDRRQLLPRRGRRQLTDVFAELPAGHHRAARERRDHRVVRARPAGCWSPPVSGCRCGGTGLRKPSAAGR